MNIIPAAKRIFMVISVCFLAAVLSCKETKSTEPAPLPAKDVIKAGEKDEIVIIPVSHASVLMKTKDKTVLVDPVGEKALYASFPSPDLILVTHGHGDHLAPDLIKALQGKNTVVVCPAEQKKDLPGARVMKNGDTAKISGIEVTAVPAYNLSPDKLKFHPKGKGNGYIVVVEGKRIYIAGDTEDIPEMKALKNIDAAFICMNLPYTMTEEQAVSAVLAFKPAIVYPYHYRGAEKKFSDLEKFKKLVSVDKGIAVRVLKWY